MLQGERDVTQQEICAINTVTRNDSFFGFLVPLCYDKGRVWFWAALTVWQEMAFHATSTISSLFLGCSVVTTFRNSHSAEEKGNSQFIDFVV